MKDGRNRKNIQIGSIVEVVQKNHQRTGELTEGIVSRLLTKSLNHPHGIKVQLESGIVGRVKNVIEEE
ncbi:YwbE family protein [Tenacibaculum halocynthiae]|uniref:YwbE family protein n=1 Tax=Tenacibaculum halocynthiae TaxID=1254437 RepID=UPI003D654565